MTQSERAQVVELLRMCAAGESDGLSNAAATVYGDGSIIGIALADQAIEARFSVVRENDDADYAETCRIAAARVEDGSWP